MENARGYIFISDAHLNSLDEHTEAFNSLLRNSLEEKLEVFLLGDIFDLWFGKKNLTFPYQKKVIDEIASLKEKGLKIHYVEGNRDFFLVDSWIGQFFSNVSDYELPVTLGRKQILLLHGDMVNSGDLQYRFWKTLSKNSIIYTIFSLIPGTIALSIANFFEKNLKRTNPRFRSNFPEEAVRIFAEKQFEKGYDMVIIGHFHREVVLRSEGHESSKMLVCLPTWKENWRYFYMDSDGAFGFKNFKSDCPII